MENPVNDTQLIQEAAGRSLQRPALKLTLLRSINGKYRYKAALPCCEFMCSGINTNSNAAANSIVADMVILFCRRVKSAK